MILVVRVCSCNGEDGGGGGGAGLASGYGGLRKTCSLDRRGVVSVTLPACAGIRKRGRS